MADTMDTPQNEALPEELTPEESTSKEPMWHPERSRRILKRIVIVGDLELLTPASFSNGDSDDLVDITLLVDACDGKSPLFTGASLAGALRAYLAAIDEVKAIRLFGGKQKDPDGAQSSVIVDDARGENGTIEVRDGVRIDPKSRTAKAKMLYNREVWSAGARFPLRLEALVCEPKGKYNPPTEQELQEGLAVALAGINSGAITFGGRKTRGFGRAEVKKWTVKTYDLTDLADLQAWIFGGSDPGLKPRSVVTEDTIAKALKIDALPEDTRPYFEMKLTMALEGSLLIRTEGAGKYEPDAVHLRGRNEEPILSGTSLAGVLRARAAKIVKSCKAGGDILVEEMFGTDIEAMKERNIGRSAAQKEKPRGSRVRVTEQAVQNPAGRLVQNRVSIDRFTGGALETALFNEEPVFGRPDADGAQGTRIVLAIGLKDPKDHEIGLMLHLLKDLWTQDLPLGGESSVGRGRLQGIQAEISHRESKRHWHIAETKGSLTVTGGALEELEAFAATFHSWKPAAKRETQATPKEVGADGD